MNTITLKEYTTYLTKNGCIARVSHQGGYCSYFGSQVDNTLFHAVIRNRDNSKVDRGAGFYSDMTLSYRPNGSVSSDGFEGFEIIEVLN